MRGGPKSTQVGQLGVEPVDELDAGIGSQPPQRLVAVRRIGVENLRGVSGYGVHIHGASCIAPGWQPAPGLTLFP